jgi:hypothetical protein
MNKKLWAEDIEQMYAKIVQMDFGRLTDLEFTCTINILMPQAGEEDFCQ